MFYKMSDHYLIWLLKQTHFWETTNNKWNKHWTMQGGVIIYNESLWTHKVGEVTLYNRIFKN